MAFPSTTGQVMLAFSLHEIQATAGSLKNRSTSLRDKTAAGGSNATSIFEFHKELKSKLNRLVLLSTSPGLAQYAKDQFDDQAFDVVAEFQTMTTEIQNVLDWIRNNLPVSSDGFVEEAKIEADDSITAKTFSVGQTAGLRSVLDDLINTIN